MRIAHTKHLLVATALAASTAATAANPEPKRFCSDSLVRGTYAGQLQGKVRLPDGTTAAEIIGVVIRLYDGKGGVAQWDNVRNSASGYVPNRYGQGTYRVNDDCTVDVEFQPSPTTRIVERAVIVDDGRELRSITVEPATLWVTSVQQRI